MSTTIDNRVVEMQFNNKQFEQGVSQSMSTLDKLKNALKFDKSAEGIKNVTAQIDAISFSRLESNIDLISSRFTTFGIASQRVIQNITDSVMRLGKKMISSVMDPLKQGGKQRALDLAQAKFMMQGLLGEQSKVEAVMDRVGNSVIDTAYGLDEAATIASQFISSGITDLDKLENALSAVSGVAAMTGGNYSEIGDIFATVAGQGKVMASDLNRLSVRGMNGAATLGKYLGKSEKEIREMTRKGEIDFKTFSDAMYQAFGAQAKKSNETFTGALANMKAALKRIGADFYDFLLVDFRDIFNAAKGVINAFHARLGGVIKDTEKGARTVTDVVVKSLNSLKTFFGEKYVTSEMWSNFKHAGKGAKLLREELKKTARESGIDIDKMIKDSGGFTKCLEKGWLTKDIFGKTMERMKKLAKEGNVTAKQISKLADKVINGDFANGEERIKRLTKAGYDYGTIQNVVNKRLGSSVRHIEKLSNAYLKNQGYTDEEIRLLRDLAKEAKETGTPLNELMSSLNQKTTAEMMIETVWNVFKGLGKIIASVGKAFVKVFAPNSKTNKGARVFVERLYDMSKAFNLNKKQSKSLTNTFEKIFRVFKKVLSIAGKVIKFVATLTANVIKLAASFIKWLVSGNKVKVLTAALSALWSGLSKVLSGIRKIVISVAGAFTKFAKGLANFISQVKQLKGVQRLGSVLVDFGKSIADFAYSKFSKIIDLIRNLFHISGGSPKFDLTFLLNAIDFAANKLADFILAAEKLPEKLGEIASSIASKFDFGWVDVVADKVKGFFGVFSQHVDTSALDDIKDKIGGMPSNFEEAKEKVTTILTGIADTIKEKARGFDVKTFKKILGMSALGVLVLGLVKFFLKLKKTLKDIDDIRFAFSDMMRGFTDVLKAQANETNASAFEKIATSIVKLAGAIFLLSFVPADIFDNVVNKLAALAIVIGLLMKLNQKASAADSGCDALNLFVKKITGIFKDFTSNLAKAFDKVAIAALLVAVGVTVGLLVGVMAQIKNIGDLAQGAIVVYALLNVLTGFVVGISMLAKGTGKDLAGAAVLILSLGVVVTVLTALMAAIGALPIKIFQNGFFVLTVLLIEITAFLFALNKIGETTGIIKTAAGLLVLAGAITILAGVLVVLGVLSPIANAGIKPLMGIAFAIVMLSAASKLLGDATVSASILVMAAAIIVLTAALIYLGANVETAIQGMFALAIAVAMLVVLAIAAEALEAGFLALTAVLIGFAAAAIGFAAAAAGIGIAALGIGYGLKAVAEAIAILKDSLPQFAQAVVDTFKIIIANAPLIIGGITVIVVGVAAAILAGSPLIGAAVVGVIIGIIYAIKEHGPEIWAAFQSLCVAIYKGTLTLVKTIWTGIVATVKYIIANLPSILLGIGAAIMDIFAEIHAMVLDGIANSWIGMIPGVKEALNGWSKTLRTTFDRNEGKKTTEGYGQGLKDGVTDTTQDLPDYMKNIGAEGSNQFGLGFGEGLDITKITDAKGNILDGFNMSDELGQLIDADNLKMGEFGKGLDPTKVGNNVDAIKKKYGELGDVLDDPKLNKVENRFDGALKMPDLSQDTSKIKQNADAVVNATNIADKVSANADKTKTAADKFGNIKIDTTNVKNGADQFVKSLAISDKVSAEASKTKQAMAEFDSKDVTIGKVDTSKLDKSLSDSSKSSKSSGKNAGDAYISAFNKALTKATGVKDAGEKAGKTAAKGAKSTRGEFVSAGKYAIAGFNAGADALGNALYNKGVAVGRRFVAGVKAGKALNESSPSKAMYDIGVFAIAGFINAVDFLMGDVEKKGKETGRVARLGVENAIDGMNALLASGLDDTPVIAPVVDLTNVRQGVKEIDRSFGRQTIAVSNGVMANAASMAVNADRIQNANSNSDVVAAIGKLRRDIGNIQSNVTYVNGVTYDDGSNIHDAVGTLIRAAVVQRRA